MAKKTHPVQSNTLNFSKTTSHLASTASPASKALRSKPAPPPRAPHRPLSPVAPSSRKRARLETEGTEESPLCLDDSSDDDIVVVEAAAVSRASARDARGKGKAKEESPPWGEEEGGMIVDEEGLLEMWEEEEEREDRGTSACSQRSDPCSRSHHESHEDQVSAPPSPSRSTSLRSLHPAFPDSAAPPSAQTRRPSSVPPDADIIDLDAEDDVDLPPDLVGGEDEDEGWNAADDEQDEQLDPGEDEDELGDFADGEGDLDELGGRAGGSDIDDEQDEEDASPRASTSLHRKSYSPITSYRHVLSREPSPPPAKVNAFSMLMAKNKEPDQWKIVEDDRSIKRGGKVIKPGERRKAPFFKVLTGMPIAVDAFRYGAVPKVTAYLLSHAHSDHYTNLSKAWKHGPIYCSPTTGNICRRVLGVDAKWIKPLEYDVPTELPNTGGVICTMISANHCPGSAIFLFEGKRTANAGDSLFPAKFVGSPRIFRYLHCGDFRACPSMISHAAVKKGKLDEIYLDTTYLNPQYCFPSQPVVITAVRELVRQIATGTLPYSAPSTSSSSTSSAKAKMSGGAGQSAKSKSLMAGWLTKDETDEQREDREAKKKEKGEKTLFVVGTYSIGKERVTKGIAVELESKIYCDERKMKLIRDQEDDPELQNLMTSNVHDSRVHMVPLRDISPEGLAVYLQKHSSRFDRIIGFRPTGWTYTSTSGTNTTNPDIPSLLARDRARKFDASELKPGRGSSEKVVTFGVPYSEHSSFFELTCFALSVPGEPRMIATVNVGSAKSREKMEGWFKKWAAEKKKREARGQGGIVEFRDKEYW